MAEQDWTRAHHTRTDARALVWFVVFGDAPGDLRPSVRRHRVGHLPDAYDVVMVARGTRGFLDPREIVPRALHADALLEAASACDVQIVVRAELEDRADLLELRSLVGLTTAIAEQASARAVLDAQTFALRSLEAWREEVFDVDAPRVGAHLLVMRSDEPDGAWLHTRGLRKFARPDLSMRGLAQNELDRATEIVLRFAQLQIGGGVIAEGSEVRVHGWPPGWTCRHAGDLDDPDFNNTHVEITRTRRAP
ncbi:hypothetical protein [Sandaracinus amylolyticus]|uniref:hypothetical protein n=1 Tax=Sandaracinus amylolyticus TaxID=927083 RepID=UPI001F2A1183|nr:hypothetical protein [Sandaracinus amylolyticus]UJR85101.1 Hypothetical protein I5071_71810 [Sandaracinus amylolyticus]